METQRLEARREVESTRSAIQEVGRECDRGRAGEAGRVRQAKSDATMTSDFAYITLTSKTFMRFSESIMHY